jgi:RNA:NAD 2'-phosphotransferase (TPT1/KptA family)/8-oxo-dGTP pyrophosphatase MutT (NUDIX family)
VDDLDPKRLKDTLHHLLNAAGEPGREVNPDDEGWYAIDEVCSAASVMLDGQVVVSHLHWIGRRGLRLEIVGARVRLLVRRPRRPPQVPDILFHATTSEILAETSQQGVLVPGKRKRLMLSADEAQAWRVSHRMPGEPIVLYIDTLRARRQGARFFRNRNNGLYSAQTLPLRHVMNLRPDFARQLSSGGIPVRRDPDGTIRMALIEVERRSGVTWEVAKGKLELGETPEAAAVREVREEMGVDVEFDLLRFVGHVRYGFLAPGGLPRLKTIYLYLMQPRGPMEDFEPSRREGIGDVQWFTPEEAVCAVTHSSLQPLMRRAKDLVERYGLQPDRALASVPHLKPRPVEPERPPADPEEPHGSPA